MNLRSQHIPLNHHLHRINKAKHPHCPHCPNIKESVHHLLIECPKYQRERHILHSALGRDASSIPYLLTKPEAIPHLIKLINSTRRFKTTFGEVSLSTK
ncbi:hypothetical protein CY34DRAFT_92642 [Suillus luteus UH-Slu-Lm8-n1]|uniref:Reverse transcriptase zinc-binding domain-containing protein n=1 Tax=Suillus luteus UH-Slu-Lm8-n1 TaxID=930992 RepID=A0A0D0ATE0_9AGAM|nr:hypothetical protein CY34DRAFT_92642 [Suillus luteus UH-Slu-Lm8-n1]